MLLVLEVLQHAARSKTVMSGRARMEDLSYSTRWIVLMVAVNAHPRMSLQKQVVCEKTWKQPGPGQVPW